MEVPDCPFYLRHTLSLAMLDLTISCFDQEPLVFMPLCVPWLSFLCACGCRRPREGRSRKLRFHSAEATRVKCSETKHHDQSLRSPPCGIKPFHWDGESRNFAAFWQPCVCLGVSSCVSIFMYIVQYDATAGGGCVYMCIRYHEMVEGTEPLHGFAEDSNLFIH